MEKARVSCCESNILFDSWAKFQRESFNNLRPTTQPSNGAQRALHDEDESFTVIPNFIQVR